MTNGDSIFTQTKVETLPNNFDDTHRYLKRNSTSKLNKFQNSKFHLAYF